ADLGAAGVAHGRLEVQSAPYAVYVPRVLADQAPGVILQRADLAVRIGIGFARPHDALVGVQPHPPELGAIIAAAGSAADVEILAKSHRVDPRDLHRFGFLDSGQHGRRQRARPQAGHLEKRASRHGMLHILTAFFSTYSSTLVRAGGRSST